jgi:light-harvesting complex I chlorophyll a/b binding protein 5
MQAIASTPLRVSAFNGRAVQAKASAKTVAINTKVTAAAKSWMPGSKHPAHLDGTLVGDFGFDPLNLGADPKNLAWYVQAELVHARFAMLGAAGILLPEIGTKMGLLNVPVWFEAGATKFEFADAVTLAIVQSFLMGFAESKRYNDFINPGSQGEPGSFAGFEAGLGGTGVNGYPGASFDPFGYSKDPKVLESMKLKEIKNGRLAMMAMLGFYGQAAATGTGPVDNWLAHLADPFATTVASNKIAVPFL